MRSLIILIAIILFSCKKNHDTAFCQNNTTLLGKWKAYEQFRSPGAGGSWVQLTSNEGFEIEFKTDGSLGYSSNFPAGFFYDRFVDNSSNVTVTSSVTGKSDSWIYLLENGCTLSLNIFRCIEGCAYRLRKVQ